MIQSKMQSQIGLIEWRRGVIGTVSVGWGAREVWEGFLYCRGGLCTVGKTFSTMGVLALLYGFLYEPPQHDPKQNAIPDWVNRRATRGYWNSVGWLRGEGRLGGLSVL